MIPVRQSTAFELSIGPVLDASGVAVTDCVVGDFKLKKTTGDYAALNGSATLTHVSAGTYDLVLTTSDVDTVGLATVSIDDGTNTCAPVRMQVIEEAVYDRDYAASAVGYTTDQPVNTTKVGGTSQTAGDLKASLNTLQVDTDDIQTRVPAALTADGNMKADALRVAGTLQGAVDLNARLGTPAGASLSVDVAAVKTQTAAIETDTQDIQARLPTALTGGRMDSSLGAIQSGVQDVYLADIDLRIDGATADEYTVGWIKNGAQLEEGITLPKIQVVKRADGTDLIALTAMTEIGSTQSFKYDATAAERQTAGEACIVIVKATIDGSERTWKRRMGRDATT